jgi:hypothetical protein
MKKIFLIVPAAIFASAVCFGLEDIVLRPELSIMKPLSIISVIFPGRRLSSLCRDRP